MNRFRCFALLTLVTVVGLSGAGLTAGAGTVRAQDGVGVGIVDFAFEPASLDVAAGTTVTWTNNGATAHTVTADDGAFDSGPIDPGGSFSFTFATAGTFSYRCTIHPEMTGAVVVAETAGGDAQTATVAEESAPATEPRPAAADPSATGGSTQDDNAVVAVANTGIGATSSSYGSGVALGLLAVLMMLGGAAFSVRRRA